MIEQLAEMPTYEAYKDSGVEWLGEIPAHWEVRRVKNIFRLVIEPSEKNNDHELLSIYTDIGVKPRKDLEEKGNKASTTDGYWLVKKGDFIVNKLLAWMGAIGLSEFEGVTSPAYDILRPTKPIDGYFYHYLFRTKGCTSELKKHSRGIMEMRLRLYFDKFGVVEIPYPPSEVQTTIAAFLDRKTAQIEQAVAIKEQQIALLKERKQILIQNAVTRGLDPNVTMRDSGVDWIGEIPAHWSIVPIRRLVDVRDGTHDTPEYIENSENSRYLITSKDFYDGEIRFENAKSISIKDHNEISKRSKVDIGDVLMSMIGGNIGKSIIVNGFNEFSIKNVALFKTHGDFGLAKYILFYLVSGLLDKQVQLNSKGGAQGFLSLGDVRNLIFFKIPPYELQTIVTHIETQSAKIDQAIAIQQQQIDKLKEYKATLINSAVTGKIRVPVSVQVEGMR